ncbi:Sexual development activator VeA, partial [Rasamsonia emersonii CBS 393.64]
VIQQPERARACGAGAKSSADRRPVDPPPVVELRIYESDPNNDMHKTDITFAYNANFFLFATLDTARPIAQPRMSGQPPTCPVLTGVPVAGIAYLDRPAQAGYFIFPDLSVRHEGRYRLNFNLYEEVKDAKDADKDAPLPPQDNIPQTSPMKPTAPKTFLHFRLEVKSVPFTVYSAKKFPGLATSTALSRVVAEQGCRVRIRRDVRMRRRGDKGNKDYNEYDDERVYARSPRYSTPDGYAATPIERPRSTSNSTVDAPYAYGSDAQRRPSLPDYGYPPPPPYQQPAGPPAGPPAPPTHAPAYQSHLTFGSTQSQYQTPPLPPAPQPAPPTPSYSPHPPVAHARSSSNSSDYDSSSQCYPYPQNRPQTERFLPPPTCLEPPKPFNPQPYEDHRYPSSTRPPARSTTPVSAMLPPIKDLPPEYPGRINRDNTATNGKKVLYETDSTLTKRSHDETFGKEEDRPLQNGKRPDSEEDSSNGKQRAVPEPSPADMRWEASSMEYRRADGSTATKVRQVV